MGEAYLYLFDDMDRLGERFVAENMPKLPAFRRERCARYRQESDKKAYIIAYRLLEIGLAERFGISGSIEFAYNEHGKPYLKDYPHTYFNISHCRSGVACAVADVEIGVDIQEVRPFDVAVARKVCSEPELRQLSESDDPAKLFCQMWTKRESYTKAKGISVASVLKQELPQSGFSCWDMGECQLAVYSGSGRSFKLKRLTVYDID